MSFRTGDCCGSCHPLYAMIWISETDSAKSVEDLRTSRSILGNNLPNFETLDAKIAISLKKLLAANDLRKKAFIEAQKAQNEKQTHLFEEDKSVS